MIYLFDNCISYCGKLDLTVDLLQNFHRVVFGGVFPDFAGRVRGLAPQYIPYAVTFRSYRGEIYDRVPDACEKLCLTVVQLISELDGLQTTIKERDFDEEGLKVAAYMHCEIIRIHPFVNGNGHMARTCINYFAARYGYLPVPFECLKGEYIEAKCTWLQQKRIEHFVDFLRPDWQRKPVAP